VFSFDLTTGAENVVYSFCKLRDCTDGSVPQANLINVNGILYGTTFKGGDRGVGTVFALDPTTNVESTIYSFCSRRNCKDGEEPVAGLIDAHGTLYGTTIFGGDQKGCIEPSHTRLTLRYPHDRDRQRSRCGTVFAIKHPDRNDLPGGACFYSATRADRFLFFLIAQSCDADSTCAQAGFGQASAAGVSPSDGPKSGKKEWWWRRRGTRP
jgi:uncharacterized repeat protein (TIGR03803 family)